MTTLRDRGLMAARVAGGGLLGASAAVHLDLYLTGYRTVPTIGWLFLLQVAGGLLAAALVLATGHRLVAAAGALFALGTLGGYLLSVWVGLFGFREVRTSAGVAAGVLELAAFAALASVAAFGTERDGLPHRARSGSSALGRAAARPSTRVGAVAAALAVSVALFVAALATASRPPAAGTSGAALGTTNIHGVRVLTDAKGFTLYWFALDTPTTSRCVGTCTAYWPPMIGRPAADAGLTGRLGTIRRPDGSLQATYDGHPLYTYVGDSRPHQAHGNRIDLNGGFWYEATASGTRA